MSGEFMRRVVFLVIVCLILAVFNLYPVNMPGMPGSLYYVNRNPVDMPGTQKNGHRVNPNSGSLPPPPPGGPRGIQINTVGTEDDKYTKAAIEAVKKNAEIVWAESKIDNIDTIEKPQDIQSYITRISAVSEKVGGKKTFLIYFETVEYTEKNKERILTKQSQLCKTFFDETFNPDSLEPQILAKYFQCIRINVLDYEKKMDAKSPISSKNTPMVVIADENGAEVSTLTKRNRSSGAVLYGMMDYLKGKKINLGKVLAEIKNLYDVLMIGAHRDYFTKQVKVLTLQAKGKGGRTVSAQSIQKAQEDADKAKEKLEALKKQEIAIFNSYGAELPMK